MLLELSFACVRHAGFVACCCLQRRFAFLHKVMRTSWPLVPVLRNLHEFLVVSLGFALGSGLSAPTVLIGDPNPLWAYSVCMLSINIYRPGSDIVLTLVSLLAAVLRGFDAPRFICMPWDVCLNLFTLCTLCWYFHPLHNSACISEYKHIPST